MATPFEIRQCACGCGAPPREGRAYIHGHHMRGKSRPDVSAKLRHENPMHRPEVLAKTTGDRAVGWKGAAVGYSGLHMWLRKYLAKTGVCADCGASGKRTEWANLSGEYHRERDDFRELCVRCHRALDKKVAAA